MLKLLLPILSSPGSIFFPGCLTSCWPRPQAEWAGALKCSSSYSLQPCRCRLLAKHPQISPHLCSCHAPCMEPPSPSCTTLPTPHRPVQCGCQGDHSPKSLSITLPPPPHRQHASSLTLWSQDQCGQLRLGLVRNATGIRILEMLLKQKLWGWAKQSVF